MSTRDEELVTEFDKTGYPEDILECARQCGGIEKADDDWFYFRNGKRMPSRPFSLEDRWAEEDKFHGAIEILNR